MDIFAKRLRERAQQLGISNSEAARRIGLEEGRYGHYIAGRREPDLATFRKISEVLGTTPNWQRSSDLTPLNHSRRYKPLALIRALNFFCANSAALLQ